MFLFQFVVVIGSFVLYEISTKFTKSPFTGVSCLFTITTSPRLAQILSFAAAALYEIVLWLISSVRVMQFARQGKSGLVALVFRDSLAYVSLVTSSAVVTVFLWLFIPEDHSVLRSTLANVSQVIGSIICSRMLLHLRSYAQDTSNGAIALGKMSLTTINFGNNPPPPPRDRDTTIFRTNIGDEQAERNLPGRIPEESEHSGHASTTQASSSSYSWGNASSTICIAGTNNV